MTNYKTTKRHPPAFERQKRSTAAHIRSQCNTAAYLPLLHDNIFRTCVAPCMPPPFCPGTGQPRPAWPPQISLWLVRSPRLFAPQTARLACSVRLPARRRHGRWDDRTNRPSGRPGEHRKRWESNYQCQATKLGKFTIHTSTRGWARLSQRYSSTTVSRHRRPNELSTERQVSRERTKPCALIRNS